MLIIAESSSKRKTNDRTEPRPSLPLVHQKELLISYNYHVETVNNQSSIHMLFRMFMKILCEITI